MPEKIPMVDEFAEEDEDEDDEQEYSVQERVDLPPLAQPESLSHPALSDRSSATVRGMNSVEEETEDDEEVEDDDKEEVKEETQQSSAILHLRRGLNMRLLFSSLPFCSDTGE